MFDNPSDRTVFKQPTPGGDRTGLRGRAASLDAVAAPERSTTPINVNVPVDSINTDFNASQSVNPVVSAASTLIAVFAKTRSTSRHSDVGSLYQRLAREIKEFESELRDLNLKQEQVLAARYWMCSVLDEGVLNTPWGSESPWAQRTLLSVFHGETSGGEKSFLIVDKLKQSPSENIYLIELFYILVSLGFEGRYKLLPRGKEALEGLRDELFSIIRRYRKDYERALSPAWKGVGRLRAELTEYIPLWFVAALAGAVLFFSYTGLRYWLYASSTPVVEEIITLIKNNV